LYFYRCINFTAYLHCKHCCDCQLVLLKKLDDDDDDDPRIWKGVEEATQTFVPACRRQIDNAEKFISTETGLVSAPYTSDKYSGLGVGIQQYADDTQLYVSLSPTDMHAQQSLLSD